MSNASLMPIASEYIGGSNVGPQDRIPEQMSSSEMGLSLLAVASERRMMLLGCVGLLGKGEPRRVGEVRDDFVHAIPGIDAFTNSANVLTDLRHTPPGVVQISGDSQTSPADRKVRLTPFGNNAIAIGGDLVDIARRHKVALRAIFGVGGNIDDQGSGRLVTTQERNLTVGMGLLNTQSPVPRTEFDSNPIYAGINTITLEAILRTWEEIGISNQEPGSRGFAQWGLSETGKSIFSDLVGILAPHIQRDQLKLLFGRAKLQEFITSTDSERKTERLDFFKRDYEVSGALQRSKIEKIGDKILSALFTSGVGSGELLTTNEVGQLIDMNLAPRQLYMVNWWFGQTAPLEVDESSSTSRRVVWRVKRVA